ncbi:MAG: DNA repair protein RadC [Bacteroidales bacterium]|nr:DNA repair protein RadC [Bacteroidales bacterium]MDO4212568.1 DNA repair protein RadC [Bacteroidales bacterium]
MKLQEMNVGDLPREKMLSRGPEALSDSELLAILLRSGARGENVVELSSRLLKDHDGKLTGLFSTSLEVLCGYKGIGKGKACSIAAAFELGKRFMAESGQPRGGAVVTARDAFSLLMPHFKALDHEECWVLLLNGGNRLIDKRRLTSGGQKATVIDIPQIIRTAIEKRASSIILAHNHPSGIAEPSKADLSETMKLRDAAQICHISLLDHLIITDKEFFSFADERQYGI